MHLITKKVTQLSPLEYRACSTATFGDRGYMQTELQRARQKRTGYENSKAVMIWSDPVHDKTSKLIAWCLLTPTKSDSYNFYSTPYQKRHCKYYAEFWVKQQYRRQGLGTKLMKHVSRHYEPKPIVIPHDDASGELFSKFNIRLSYNDGNYWIRKKPKIA